MINIQTYSGGECKNTHSHFIQVTRYTVQIVGHPNELVRLTKFHNVTKVKPEERRMLIT